MIKGKILAIIYRKMNNSEEFLVLKKAPDQMHGPAVFYVVTGAVEKGEDLTTAVRREIEEETGIKNIVEIKDLNKIYEYKHPAEGDYLCQEHCFGALVNDEVRHLSFEHTEYKWLDKEDFIDTINWYYDKEDLKKLLNRL